MAGLTERPQVRPPQPEIGPLLDADDVVGLLRRSTAARCTADGEALPEQARDGTPVRIVALRLWSRAILNLRGLTPTFGFFPSGHTGWTVARRSHRHQSGRSTGRGSRGERGFTGSPDRRADQ